MGTQTLFIAQIAASAFVHQQRHLKGCICQRHRTVSTVHVRREMHVMLHDERDLGRGRQQVLDVDEESPLLLKPEPVAELPPGLVERTAPLDPRVLAGEFLSTFLFVYLSVYGSVPLPGAPPPALLNGAVIAAVACSFMPVSGAHLNPAVTAALLVTRRVSPIRAVAFVPIQLFASGLASLAVKSLGVPVGVPAIPAGATILRALMDEIFPMALIVFVVFQTAVATKEEGGVGGPLAAIYIGFAVLACAGTFSTGVFNPARAFGPTLVAGSFASHWIYWVGPFIGAVLAALVSEHFFMAPVTGRKPKSWLYVLMKRVDGFSNKLRTLGTAGLVTAGIGLLLQLAKLG